MKDWEADYEGEALSMAEQDAISYSYERGYARIVNIDGHLTFVDPQGFEAMVRAGEWTLPLMGPYIL